MLQGFRNLLDDEKAIELEYPMVQEIVELECAC